MHVASSYTYPSRTSVLARPGNDGVATSSGDLLRSWPHGANDPPVNLPSCDLIGGRDLGGTHGSSWDFHVSVLPLPEWTVHPIDPFTVHERSFSSPPDLPGPVRNVHVMSLSILPSSPLSTMSHPHPFRRLVLLRPAFRPPSSPLPPPGCLDPHPRSPRLFQ